MNSLPSTRPESRPSRGENTRLRFGKNRSLRDGVRTWIFYVLAEALHSHRVDRQSVPARCACRPPDGSAASRLKVRRLGHSCSHILPKCGVVEFLCLESRAFFFLPLHFTRPHVITPHHTAHRNTTHRMGPSALGEPFEFRSPYHTRIWSCTCIRHSIC